ncbi:hypothetical protein ACIOD1_29495 [Streptomyces sp. NPDC088097]|uniref:hypothetical protein n=1 Tax=Streptomyces sp. NPDC088097 TaxID=3365823 RepID=UPI00381803E5
MDVLFGAAETGPVVVFATYASFVDREDINAPVEQRNAPGKGILNRQVHGRRPVRSADC